MKIIIALSTFFIIISNSAFSQNNFYAEDTIQLIEITFTNNNWDYQLDTAKYGAGNYLLASEVKINGVVFDSAGVRYKGNSSYDSSLQKNPMHIKLDFIHNNANYFGYEDIKLSNGFSDPSCIREVMAYKILRNYMHAPLCNFAKVYINGIYYGVYSNAEDISSVFLEKHFYSSDKTFVKGNPESVINGHLPNLTYLGTDSSLYYDRYEMKSDYAWKDVVNLCNALVNSTPIIDSFIDIDRALWMLAFNNVTVNLDSYSGQFAQNYYLYRDHNNLFNPIIWDLNMCFGSFTNTGTANLNLAQMQQLTPLLHNTNASRPLIKNLLADTSYLKMYLAHASTINDEFFSSGNYQLIAQNLQSLIDTSVQSENFSLYTYPEFQNGLITSVGSVPGITELMNSRFAYLNSTPQFQQIAPVITNIISNPSVPVFGNSVAVNATVINSTRVYLGYRYKKSDRFVRFEMFDDGAHNDGVSGDNIFGLSIPVSSLEIQFYLYAENASAGMFSPERAEHEFYILHPTITLATQNDLAINEYTADNQTGILNENGKNRDWIEVFNKTSNALGLKNIYLSDDINDLQKWKFPDIAFIPANGFLLVWADDKDSTLIDYHTNFNLSAYGDSVFMVNDSFAFADSSTFSAFITDYSYARCPDGTGLLQLTFSPTPRSTNSCTSFISESDGAVSKISIYPNPASNKINFAHSIKNELKSIEIKTISGQIVKQLDAPSGQAINISLLASGMYFVVFTDTEKNKQTIKFVKQ